MWRWYLLTAPEKKYPTWRKLDPAVSFAANLVAVITILGAILSLVINGVIFALWGLNFYAIASPADIVMSGASLVVTAVILTLIVIAVGLPLGIMSYRVDRATQTLMVPRAEKVLFRAYQFGWGTRWSSKRRAYKLMRLTLNIHFQTSLSFFLFLITSVAMALLGQWIAVFSMVILQGISLGTLVSHFVFVGKIDWSEKEKSLRRSSYLASAFLFIIASELTIFYAVERTPRLIAIVPDQPCNAQLGVVWMGTESLVLRCGPLDKPFRYSDNFIIVSRENVRLKSSF
jgi:hypothetical protein